MYFGGGTPSLLPPSQLARLIAYFVDHNILASDAEITLEANPEDLTDDYVRALAQTGVNRISLGVQSFDDDILRRLGRKHTGAIARDAIARLQDYGLSNLSVDQIIGVPDEDEAQIIQALRYLSDVGVQHVSSYLLTIEEGTHFHRKKVSPSDDAQADMYLRVQREMTSLGYVQYDISSFAKPGFLSRHNQSYWASVDYLGLGPGAHSMRRHPDGSVARINNRADVKTWLLNPDASIHLETEILSPDEALREALAFGLRNMLTGMNAQKTAELYGAKLPPQFFLTVAKFKNLGWLDIQDNVYTITTEGALFADAVMREILCC